MKRPATVAAGLAIATALLLAGCGGSSSSDDPAFRTTGRGPDPATAQPQDQTTATGSPAVVGTIASGLEVPWGLAFLPDGSALVTERDSSRVLRVAANAADVSGGAGGAGGEHRVTQVGTVEQASASGESGLLGIAVSPSYEENHWVFAYTSTTDDNRILRMTFANGRLGKPKVILKGIPHAMIHDGGRLAFGPDGYLYASTGETGDGQLAQDSDSLGGKILRITQDGRPAPGNPRDDSPVWTLGHRNVQGLAWDDAGRMWASEFGDSTWDELNLIQKGTNYGWPKVEGRGSRPEFRNPQVVWRTADASPSGLAFTDGHLWLASLRGARLWRVSLSDGKALEAEDFFVGRYGRMRAVVRAPDGNLWVTTSNRDGRGEPSPKDDRILLVRP